jgi:hypothetical protein
MIYKCVKCKKENPLPYKSFKRSYKCVYCEHEEVVIVNEEVKIEIINNGLNKIKLPTRSNKLPKLNNTLHYLIKMMNSPSAEILGLTKFINLNYKSIEVKLEEIQIREL